MSLIGFRREDDEIEYLEEVRTVRSIWRTTSTR
jgi:hypothetical protein